MGRQRTRTYKPEERSIALIFYERIKHKDNAVAEAAKLANVEEDALRFWLGGGNVTHPDLEPEPESDSPDVTETLRALAENVPEPPAYLADPLRYPVGFADAKDLAAWAHKHFISENGAVWNEEHWHLQDCLIAWEWTNVANERNMKGITATTQKIGAGGGGRWDKAREAVQLRRVWGDVPEFRITVDAVQWGQMTIVERGVIVDHELSHCGLKVDPLTGVAKPSKGKLPYALRGHDFEGFVNGYRRWGVGEAGVAELLEAAEEVKRRGPLITQAHISRLCGNCLGRS